MRRLILGFAALTLFAMGMVLPTGAGAQGTFPPCDQQQDLACSSADDTINASWTFATGEDITFSNFGAQFAESDTNPTCAAGDYKVFADLSDGKLKKCENGSVTDLDTGGGATAWSDLVNPTAALALSFDAAETTTFTWTGLTGTASFLTLKDATGNTGTGYLLDLNTVGTSTANVLRATAGGTANGVQLTSAGLLEPIGTGSIEASDVVCTTCVGTADLADNAVDGTKIGIGTTNGDLLAYNGADWAPLASAAGFLKGSAAGTPAYTAISAADIGPGDLVNAIERGSCTADNCVMTTAPATVDHVFVWFHTLMQRRVDVCGGVNEFALQVNAQCTGAGTPWACCTGAGTGTCDGKTIAFCGTAPSTGADAAFYLAFL